jgi:hypothetical protein
MYFLYNLYKNKNKVNNINLYIVLKNYINFFKLDLLIVKYKFGFLYNEYKKESYFWEIVKIF